ncbi:hypothetical protein F5Y04DRAFT_229920 [Hypomontagnella monticulosa]|nr:hypothetical protein F5Y04DRAFT_229920 [Hypomontagnella monticulosa]
MELTPINVRGKRRRGDDSVVVLPPKSRKRARKTKVKSREEKASILEKMPLEILEKIFWLSGNLNLPLSSPLIGRVLSGESTLCATLLRAFEPTWSYWFNIVMERGRNRCRHGDGLMQSRLLEFPWASVDIILKTWDIFIQRIAKNHLVVRAPMIVIHPRIWGDPEDVTNTLAEDEGVIVDSHDTGKAFWHDYDAFRKVEDLGTKNFEWFAGNFDLHTFFFVHREFRIPDVLFTSPCTDDLVKKLFWLLRAGAHLARDQTWELTLQAFHHAVPMTLPDSGQINLTMVRILDAFCAFEKWPAHVRFDEITRLTNCQPDHPGMNPPDHTWLAYEYTLRKLKWASIP